MHPSNSCNASILIDIDMAVIPKNSFTTPNITMGKHTYKVRHSA
uniref:Uncharacterized protein n=1 Tax=Lotus japonicus TaxID=34305 RepID=I3T000_LOTJA|nr:unknown [Lotus japonicus]